MSKTLPESREDELRLLSCCFLDGSESFSKAISAGVSMSTFTDHRNRAIFSAMASVMASGGVIDPPSVASVIQARGQVEQAGGWAHIESASKWEPTTQSSEIFIRRLRNLEVLRGVIIEAERLSIACRALKDDDPATVIDPSLSKLLAIATKATDDKDKSWGEVIKDAKDSLEEILKNGGVPKHMAIPFPWEKMNDYFNPMQRGQLIVLAARPSVGKSSLARPIALHAAKTGFHVYFASLEVKNVKVPLQMAATLSGVSLKKAHQAHRKDQDDLRRALGALDGLPITIADRDKSISRILGRARALKSQGKLDLLVIDHGLQLQEAYGARDVNQAAAIGAVTKSLKNLATDLDIAVLLLWQLNRDSVKGDNREPGLHDLKGSGSLEEDADKVIFIHRPSTNPVTQLPQDDKSLPEECPSFFQQVIQAKGRDDGTGFMSFMFKRETATFAPVARQ